MVGSLRSLGGRYESIVFAASRLAWPLTLSQFALAALTFGKSLNLLGRDEQGREFSLSRRRAAGTALPVAFPT